LPATTSAHAAGGPAQPAGGSASRTGPTGPTGSGGPADPAGAPAVSAAPGAARSRPLSRIIQDQRPGLAVERDFTRQGVDPFDTVEWERRDAVISGADGKVFFEQRGVEFPKTWSQTATNVVVQKYFRGTLGTPQREDSVRAMIGRVADTIYGWG